ncbi:MAG: hypothetical protein KIT73_07760 [Burkholderiales bacterium]|nr:hypothetical protein [Burkholderiales bacterium]
MIADLGTFGGTSSRAYDINNSGRIVGTAMRSGNDNTVAFITDGNTLIDVWSRAGFDSRAYSVNASGQVVGTFGSDRWDSISAFSSGPNGTSPFLFEDHPFSSSWDINDAGRTVGYTYFEVGTRNERRGFVTDENDIPIMLPSLGGPDSDARAINNLGQIAGDGASPGWEAREIFIVDGGEIRSLGNLPGSRYGIARDINDAGQIVGVSGSFAFVSEPGGGALINLGSSLPGTTNEALAINNHGSIVGVFVDSAGDETYRSAFFYRNGVALDLSELQDVRDAGWTRILEAAAINDHGVIVGTGIIGGQERAFVLSPVPEPYSYVLFAWGLMLLSLYTWRQAQRHDQQHSPKTHSSAVVASSALCCSAIRPASRGSPASG